MSKDKPNLLLVIKASFDETDCHLFYTVIFFSALFILNKCNYKLLVKSSDFKEKNDRNGI